MSNARKGGSFEPILLKGDFMKLYIVLLSSLVDRTVCFLLIRYN